MPLLPEGKKANEDSAVVRVGSSGWVSPGAIRGKRLLGLQVGFRVPKLSHRVTALGSVLQKALKQVDNDPESSRASFWEI
jgi:hypothetical protein